MPLHDSLPKLEFSEKGSFCRYRLNIHGERTESVKLFKNLVPKTEFSEQRKFLQYWIFIHEESTENLKAFHYFVLEMEFPKNWKRGFFVLKPEHSLKSDRSKIGLEKSIGKMGLCSTVIQFFDSRLNFVKIWPGDNMALGKIGLH